MCCPGRFKKTKPKAEPAKTISTREAMPGGLSERFGKSVGRGLKAVGINTLKQWRNAVKGTSLCCIVGGDDFHETAQRYEGARRIVQGLA
jgi:hypothetical protein